MSEEVESAFESVRLGNLKELNEEVEHYDKQIKMCARAKSRAYDKIAGNLSRLLGEEICGLDSVEDFDIELSHDPESATSKTIKFNIYHNLDGEMTFEEFNDFRSNLVEKVHSFIDKLLEEAEFKYFVDVPFGDLDLVHEDSEGDEE